MVSLISILDSAKLNLHLAPGKINSPAQV